MGKMCEIDGSYAEKKIKLFLNYKRPYVEKFILFME